MSLSTQSLPATPQGIARAAKILRGGGLVAFATETVYGLGGDATNDLAVARIFEAKGRPRFNPLIVHVSDLAMAERFALFDTRARKIAAQFWPGPLTLVLPLRKDAGLSPLIWKRLRSACPPIPARWPCCRPSAARSPRPRPIFRGAFHLPAPNM